MDETTLQIARCPRCGRALAADLPEGLCPQCLFNAATETLTGAGRQDDSSTSTSAGARAVEAVLGARLTDGGQWGGYRIVRLLGAGGMGEVYEAEQLASGRRVALKVLRGQLQLAEDRARFLREGQLAASISHPHTVYIFGSEEIDRMPVITMELLPGGTLKDRVVESGPMAPADAATAVLEIIGGLDAAQAAGILHRDIKPSNCFLDHDGGVKVGDFGLSISTLARDVKFELATSGFQGTPQYAPPEQLRGEPLDVRADIYAVGATLYYLLTGQPPFDAPDLRELFSRVTNEPAPSPRLLRPDIPGGLAAIVLRCLSKTPADRPASYAMLADMLRPFSDREHLPARPGPRLIAGVIDNFLIGTPAGLLLVSLSQGLGPGVTTDVTTEAIRPFGIRTWSWVALWLYYLMTEGVWGRSIGKLIFGLRVSAPTGAATFRQIAIRASVFQIPSLLTSFVVLAAGSLPILVLGNIHTTQDLTRSALNLTIVAALFVTARSWNGWAALQDLASGTHVVTGTRVDRHAITSDSRSALPRPVPAQGKFGPYDVVADLGRTEDGVLSLAFDSVLRRPVWIHRKPFSPAEHEAARRDASRIGRLHWLSGQRIGGGRWDAYEAPEGDPFLAYRKPIDWKIVKPWLIDLSDELLSASRDGSLPPLAMDRLWLRRDGHLVLLDFNYPGAKAMAADDAHTLDTPSGPMTPVALLSSLLSRAASARDARTTGPGTLPLSARRLLNNLASATPPSLDAVRDRLLRLSVVPESVQRGRRAIPLALAAFPMALVLTILAALTPSILKVVTPENGEMFTFLDALRAPQPRAGSRLVDPAIRDAEEIYVAGRWGAKWRDDRFWDMGPMSQGSLPAQRTYANEILARHPSVTPEELARVTAILAPEIERARRAAGGPNQGRDLVVFLATLLSAFAIIFSLTLSLLSAALAPGGVVSGLIGLAVVTEDGREISRARSLLRAVVAWSPAIAWSVYLASSPKVQGWVPQPGSPVLAISIALTAMTAGAIWTILHPTRGVSDRIAGTWIVPR